MMSRLKVVATELGVDQMEAEIYGENTIRSGMRLDWAEKQMRAVYSATYEGGTRPQARNVSDTWRGKRLGPQNKAHNQEQPSTQGGQSNKAANDGSSQVAA
eukprot:4047688-Prymnesium_polylepis.1